MNAAEEDDEDMGTTVIIGAMDIGRITPVMTVAIVGGVRTRAMLDTGASVSMINKELAGKIAEVDKKVVQWASVIKAYNHQTSRATERLQTKVMLAATDTNVDVTADIAEKTLAPLILGMDWLKKAGVVLDLARNKGTMGNGRQFDIQCTKVAPADVPIDLLASWLITIRP